MLIWIVEAYGELYMAGTPEGVIRLVEEREETLPHERLCSLVPIPAIARMIGNFMFLSLPGE